MLARLLPIVWKNLLRNRRRSLLTVLGVAVAIFVSAALQAAILGITFPAREVGAQRLLNTSEAARVIALASRLPASYEDAVAEVPGVAAATGVFTDLAVTGKDRVHIFVTGVDPARYRLVKRLRVDEGEWATFSGQRSGAIVGHRLLARMGWRVGDEVEIREVGLRIAIVGAIPPQKVDLENHLLVHREYLQLLRGAAGQVSYILSNPAAAADPQVLAAAIDARFSLAPVTTKSVSAAAYAEAIISRFMGFISYLKLMAFITVLVTMLGAANAIAMSVRERTREIGMLKAIGYSPGLILALILAEAVALSVLGGVLGIAAAGAVVGSEKANMAGLMLSAPVYLQAAVSAVLIGLVGGIFPARFAAGLRTIDALRAVE